MDRLSPDERSALMGKIKQKNTSPERSVRSLLHKMGLRFRLHRKDLPGTPDIVLPRFKVAIQVHGCFWHRHRGCSDATQPKSNTEFWISKFAKNVNRDRLAHKQLRRLGWKVIIVWECELKDLNTLEMKLQKAIT